MIAVQNANRSIHSRKSSKTTIPTPHFQSIPTLEQVSQGLADQVKMLHQLIGKVYSLLDARRLDVRGLVQTTDDLRDQLATCYLWKEMLDDEPEIAFRFHRQAAAVVAERSGIYMDACEIADDSRDLLFQSETPLRQRVEDLRDSFESWCQRLRLNEQKETDLIVRTAYEDIGVGD